MARVVHFYQTGGPEVLKIDEIPTPEPKAGEVRIRAHALGLNRAESMYRSGRYVIEPKFPAKLGYWRFGRAAQPPPFSAMFRSFTYMRGNSLFGAMKPYRLRLRTHSSHSLKSQKMLSVHMHFGV